MERSGLRVTLLAEPDLLLLGRLQQLGESQVQRFGKSSQSAEGGISETPLDLADVRTVGPGQLAQPVLTPASTDAGDSDGLTECPREVVGVRHGAQRTAGQALRPPRYGRSYRIYVCSFPISYSGSPAICQLKVGGSHGCERVCWWS